MLGVGAHQALTATFTPTDTADYNPTSATVFIDVAQAGTSTAVTSSVSTPVFGQSVTFTATVAIASLGVGTPTGTVTFKDGSNTLGTGTLSHGTATLTVPSTSPVIAALAVGTHSITASYGGDTNDLTSTSSALTETVNQNQTTTSVSVSTKYLTDNQAVPLGQEVTLAATVTANESTVAPTGLVDFFDGPTKLDTVTLSHGTATLSTSMLVVGDHTIRADYHGDGANFAGSTSNRLISISTINKVAGGGTNDADGVPATSARLNEPTGVAVDASGNLFIADTRNNRVRMVSPAGMIYTVAGGGDGGLRRQRRPGHLRPAQRAHGRRGGRLRQPLHRRYR